MYSGSIGVAHGTWCGEWDSNSTSVERQLIQTPYPRNVIRGSVRDLVTAKVDRWTWKVKAARVGENDRSCDAASRSCFL